MIMMYDVLYICTPYYDHMYDVCTSSTFIHPSQQMSAAINREASENITQKASQMVDKSMRIPLRDMSDRDIGYIYQTSLVVVVVVLVLEYTKRISFNLAIVPSLKISYHVLMMCLVGSSSDFKKFGISP